MLAVGVSALFLCLGYLDLWRDGIDPRVRFYPFFPDFFIGWLNFDVHSWAERVARGLRGNQHSLLPVGRRLAQRCPLRQHRPPSATGCCTITIAKRRRRGQGTWPNSRPGWDRMRPDFQAWLDNLDAERIQLLVVTRVNPAEGAHNVADADGFPIERHWADSHPERFEPLYGRGENDPMVSTLSNPAAGFGSVDGAPRDWSRQNANVLHGSRGQIALIYNRRSATVNEATRGQSRSRVSQMRLTLRTLLAWLDDTLQPTQVREIGSQVAESPFAQELDERIHRVTRQRRLSVPSSSGPDGTDPNVVASYLDNDLDPEAVAEYEKKCLTSDVKLAEVASVHQILSLLGQKVKVPAEAKTRMYQLVKGRETMRPKKPAVDAIRHA